MSFHVGLRNSLQFCYTSHYEERLGGREYMTVVKFTPYGGVFLFFSLFKHFPNIQLTDLSALLKIQVLWEVNNGFRPNLMFLLLLIPDESCSHSL